ncbi:thioesterase II family protein [Streptomyces thermolilacinus]|uniref:thioesterase II family protein n=1 Tax=Streptomyces thermolilacinus TaxID=285540 RepID=UPI0033F1D361
MTLTSPFRCFVVRPDAAVRLYCFPHGGGAASAFHRLAHRLPEWIELRAVQYPGRQDRYGDPMPASVEALAEELVRGLSTPFDRPTAFLGHSMGAVVAFEAARRLRPRFPSPLTALFVSACKAPAERLPRGVRFDEDEVRAYLRELGGEGARALEADEELWQLAYPVVSGDLRLIERYRYTAGAPLTCPLVAIGGENDPSVPTGDLALWKDYTDGGAEIRTVEGGHFYFEENLDPLLSILTGTLDQLAYAARRLGPSGMGGGSLFG